MADNPLNQKIAEALSSALGVSVLGYGLLDNPRGFVLAAVLSGFVEWLQDAANETAAKIDQMGLLFVEATVGTLADADPFGVLPTLLDTIGGSLASTGEDLASQLGPFGFIVIPVVWFVGAAGLVVMVFGVWRLYKWIRVVVA